MSTGAAPRTEATGPGASSDDPKDRNSSSSVASTDPISITTDQGFETGIGVYALGLLRLLRPAFPGLQLVSLDYLHAPPSEPGVLRLPGTSTVRHRVEVPLVRRRNRKLLARALPVDAAVHDCGPDYAISATFGRAVVTVHDYYPRRPSLLTLRDPVVLARDAFALAGYITVPRQVHGARAIVVPTQYVQRCLWSVAGLRSTVIRHWIDSERFRPREQADARARLGLSQDGKLLLTVGIGASNKNARLLRSIARGLPDGYRLVKVGEPLGLDGPRLLQLGRLSYHDYPLVFNACDAYLHPSLEEGFGRPLIEAIGSELPIVALDTEVAREVAADAGTYVSQGSPLEEWVRAVREATTSGGQAEARSHARKRQEAFSATTAREQYVGLYRKAFGL